MYHQIAVIQPIFRLGVEGDEMILLFTFTGHHADIIAADQRIEARDACERRFRRHQPELRLFA
ncbi:hypothetical protein SDC9_151759 [bioreactor metagenome]|uniref:Uncharacterized protein n=1 Tax=bioreactor metagenome TaxID=1076179 RepID=A0A645ER59_9ZZZZ